MGNSPAGGSVEQHVEQARKTGVCSLKERKLTQVRRWVRASRPISTLWAMGRTTSSCDSHVTVSRFLRL